MQPLFFLAIIVNVKSINPKKIDLESPSTDAVRQGLNTPSQSVDGLSASIYLSKELTDIGIPKEKQDLATITNLLPCFINIRTKEFDKPLDFLTTYYVYGWLRINRCPLDNAWECGYKVLTHRGYENLSMTYTAQTLIDAVAKAILGLYEDGYICIGQKLDVYESMFVHSIKI